MAAASSLTVGASTEAAQTATTSLDYSVTIDVTTNPYTYTYKNSAGSGPAYQLQVKQGDTVAFVAQTPNNSKHFAAVIFLPESPLVDSSGRPVHAILWPEHNPPKALTVNPAGGTYPYRIVVFDRDKETPYTEDPKIIVGGGTMRTAELVRQLHEVAEACPKERERIEVIEKNLMHLLK